MIYQILVPLLSFVTLSTCQSNRYYSSFNRIRRKDDAGYSIRPDNMRRWMANIPDELSMARMSIPGTHDSAAQNFKDFFCILINAKTQQWSIAQQLYGGVRFLDVRLHYKGDSGLYLYHGPCDTGVTFTELLNSVARFLKRNPTEAVLMRIKQEFSQASDLEFINRYDGLMEVPTMGEARGKMVIISNVAFLRGIMWDHTSKQDHYATDKKLDKVHRVKTHLIKTALANVAVNDNQHLYLNFLSATGQPSQTPKKMAKFVNKEIQTYVKTRNPTELYGVVIMDYPRNDLIRNVIRHNAYNSVQIFTSGL